MKSMNIGLTVTTTVVVLCLGQVAKSSEHSDANPQVIILKLDDVVAHTSTDASPVSPRWQRVTDLAKSRGCVFMTPSEYRAHIETTWAVHEPILRPGPKGSFSEISVKDPSIVYAHCAWHLFFTARSREEYTTGYVSAPDLSGLQSAPRHELNMIRGKTRYGCAPQVFFYAPQGLWYLLFQNRDANYQPAFSTTKTIANPQSWSKPLPLMRKDEQAKWIDFWIICDDTKAHLFYTQAHRGVVVRATSLTEFPHGWGKGQEVLTGVHEAVHIYRVKGHTQFHMIYELNRDGVRSFGLATAASLMGPWNKVTDDYATTDQLTCNGQSTVWTDMVSHGEVVRSGYDQHLEYDPEACQWIIQGIRREAVKGPYPSLPWKLGIIRKSETQD
jgi:hypothetical protein